MGSEYSCVACRWSAKLPATIATFTIPSSHREGHGCELARVATTSLLSLSLTVSHCLSLSLSRRSSQRLPCAQSHLDVIANERAIRRIERTRFTSRRCYARVHPSSTGGDFSSRTAYNERALKTAERSAADVTAENVKRLVATAPPLLGRLPHSRGIRPEPTARKGWLAALD
ncbi:hypothetical protein ACS0PU_003023 [Formica fusca]